MNGKVVLGKRIRHLSRYQEIAQILIRNGFGWFLDEIGLTHMLTLPRRWFVDGQFTETMSLYERIRVVIEQLGPTFVKMAQVASLRTDVFPEALIQQLSRLHDDVPAMPNETVRHVIESEFQKPMEALFADFAELPIGAASIGQVHQATLHSGEVVAVKVQRPDIRRNIEVDVEILADIIHLAEKHFEWAKHYELSDVLQEFRRTLLNECDFTIEARNADRIRKMFEQDDTVYIPAIHWDFTTPKVLVMEYVDGIKFSDRTSLREMGFNPQILAKRTAKAVLTQILIHGFFHADPHPGNLAALPGNVILFMDFGMVGRLNSDMKRRLAGLIIGLRFRNTDLIIRALYRMGVVPADVDEGKLRRDVDELREKYYDVALSQVNISEPVRELLAVAFRHRIKIPPDLSLVGKTLVTIEGVVEHLDPTFRIMDVAEPFGKRLLKEQLDPKSIGRHAVSSMVDAAELLIELPRQIRLLTQQFRQGKAKVQVEIPVLQNALKQLERISNRLSFSVMLLAFSIFMSGLMIASSLAKTSNAVFNVPITDVGLAIGVLMAIALIWSIFKSGRM